MPADFAAFVRSVVSLARLSTPDVLLALLPAFLFVGILAGASS